MTTHYPTLKSLKRAAIKLKRESGLTHSAALERIARTAGFGDFHAATQWFAPPSKPGPAGHVVTIVETWRSPSTGTGGTLTRTVTLTVALGDLVKPHQLAGYLGGCKLRGLNTLVGFGDSPDAEEALLAIERLGRTLQFMAATGLKPTESLRRYPGGRWANRPPGTDHDKGWYHPETGSYVLTEEPYPGRLESHRRERAAWAQNHGWRTVRAPGPSLLGRGTELYLNAPTAGGVDVIALATLIGGTGQVADADTPPKCGLGEAQVRGEFGRPPLPTLPGIETFEMSPELAAALERQYALDRAEAGPRAPEPSILHRGVEVASRWSIARELETMMQIVDAVPGRVRPRILSIWCDSKAPAYYVVTMRPDLWTEGLEEAVLTATLAVTKGFNGLDIDTGARTIALGAEWPGEEGI
ncbi:hypothetical protein [Brevundimonas nasdae]|uniref:Uncharacterized protein n=1 Tax=Brevundimonas nasdae TaxID=172043 RepID=A0ABX8TJN9_9CAUL|nr:hypothetical protein [Brevundimonas nasdae]QYC11437.1 hypothetical protein KWG56_05530 [Brevundimonas nasdae]QYC14225.1 hypothetical protein KWG63_00865 [Brevundimonas nasdae]